MGLRLPSLRAGHDLRLLEGSAEFFPALVAAIDAALATRTRAEWAEIFRAQDVWWAPVNSIDEVIAEAKAAGLTGLDLQHTWPLTPADVASIRGRC